MNALAMFDSRNEGREGLQRQALSSQLDQRARAHRAEVGAHDVVAAVRRSRSVARA